MRQTLRVGVALSSSLLLLAGTAAAAGEGSGSALPDPELTPGDTRDAVTQENIATTICTNGYVEGVRNVPEKKRERVFDTYDIDEGDRSKYTIDHLVPLSVGGSNGRDNLWPQVKKGNSGTKRKNKAERRIRRAVCNGVTTLSEGQALFIEDWRDAVRRTDVDHDDNHDNNDNDDDPSSSAAAAATSSSSATSSAATTTSTATGGWGVRSELRPVRPALPPRP